MPYLKWWQPVPRACNEASVMRVQLDKHSDVRPRQWLLTAAMASSPTFWKTPRTSVNTQQKALQQTKNMGKHVHFLENWPRSIISPGLREFTQCLGSHLQAAHLHYAVSFFHFKSLQLSHASPWQHLHMPLLWWVTDVNSHCQWLHYCHFPMC